jgi:glycosyltransferase involved in cell wall biosynthesis
MVRVSVVIPTYNRRELLKKAIASVYDQTYQDFEIIVVDDGSTDGTPLDHIAPRDKLIFLSLPHTGLTAHVRNEGIAHARGEYVAFLDSDDLWAPNKLEEQLAVMGSRSGSGLSSTNALVFRADPTEAHLLNRAGLNHSGRVTEQLLLNNFVIMSTVMVRRSAIDEVGRFSEDELVRGIEDYDLWLRLSLRHDYVYLDRPLAYYLDHAHSMRSESSRRKYWEGLLRIFDKLEARGDLEDGPRRALSDARFEARFRLGIESKQEGRYLAMVRSYARLAAMRPLRFAKRLIYCLVEQAGNVGGGGPRCL